MINFTTDQQIGYDFFMKFMNDKSKKTFGFYGFSGTGKTTTLMEIVYRLLIDKSIKNVALTAPTNKAVNVMKNKFDEYIRNLYKILSNNSEIEVNELQFDDIIQLLFTYKININFGTIHKLLKFETDFNMEGKLKFSKKHSSTVSEYDLIIIDECSMLSAQIVDVIFRDIRNIDTPIKVVFSGDIAQLPAVSEINSIIFSTQITDYPYEKYLEILNSEENETKICLKNQYYKLMDEITNMEYYVMKQVVRSKSNNVLGICNSMRNYAIKGKKLQLGKYLDDKMCFAYEYTGNRKIHNNWFKAFVKQCVEKTDAIILTWTNKQCDEYNIEIRKEIFKTNKPLETYIVGDILMLSDFYNIKTDKEDKENFYTSEQIQIVKIELLEKQIDQFPLHLDRKSCKLENFSNYEKEYVEAVETINSNVLKIYKCYKMEVKRLSSNKESNSYIYVIHESYNKVIETEKTFIESVIKNLRIKLYKKFKNKRAIIDNHVISYFWKRFHSIYENSFAKVNYGYAITCHKAQGSTFYNVFVDLDNITKNININEMKKCLYTAVSRTSNQLHILI